MTSLVSGYYDGKYNAERAIEEAYGPAGVILRAPAVSGRRTLPSGERNGSTPAVLCRSVPLCCLRFLTDECCSQGQSCRWT